MEMVKSKKLQDIDPDIFAAIQAEARRQTQQAVLIASENYASEAVMEAQGSVMTNKYAEGYPGKRYYAGCEYVDQAEALAISRLEALFGAGYANVQPHSGSDANMAVFQAILQPGDTMLGMSLDAGGHLTHGHKASVSGKIYNAIGYGLDENGLIDYASVEALAKQHKPKLIIAGFSAYSQIIDWAFFARVAKECGAYFMADMAHVSGLVAAGVYPSPIPHADIVTSTTHKTLRGPRGGIILAKETSALTNKINRLVFPGLQGGPMMHTIAAKAVCFHEALSPSFKVYQQQVLENAAAMAKGWMDAGFEVISGEPKCHMFLISLASHNMEGEWAQARLAKANLICNKNSIPNDPLPPRVTSGLRWGASALTTLGLSAKEAYELATHSANCLKDDSDESLTQLKTYIAQLMQKLIQEA